MSSDQPESSSGAGEPAKPPGSPSPAAAAAARPTRPLGSARRTCSRLAQASSSSSSAGALAAATRSPSPTSGISSWRESLLLGRSASPSLPRGRSKEPQQLQPWFPYPSSFRSSVSPGPRASPGIASRPPKDQPSSASTAQARMASGLSVPFGGDATAGPSDPLKATTTTTNPKTKTGKTSGSSSPGETSLSDEDKERAHFQSVLAAFDAYLPHSLAANNARRRSYYALPKAHRTMLSSLGSAIPGPCLPAQDGASEGRAAATMTTVGHGVKARLNEIDDRIRRNADVLAQIVEDSRGFMQEASVAAGAGAGEGGGGHGHSHGAETARAEEGGSEAPSGSVGGAGEESTAGEGEANSGSSDGTPRQRVQALVEGGGDDDDKEQKPGQPRKRSITNHEPRGKRKTSSGSASASSRDVPHHDVDKVRSTLKQFVRDWSLEGAAEREAAYGPILDAIDQIYGEIPFRERAKLKVLVPGAGLGRLSFEISYQGYSCQGNEFSFFMLLASHFILNKTTRAKERIIYPFVHSCSNIRSSADMLRPIAIPDVNPTDLPPSADFSMVAGEFVEVYSKAQERSAWNAVATCFFIDTARNIVRYLEVISHVLPIGGHWINVGPLLWHYEGNGELSVELTLDELLPLIDMMGFQILEQRPLPPQPYTGDATSMLSYLYQPHFILAQKVRDVVTASTV